VTTDVEEILELAKECEMGYNLETAEKLVATNIALQALSQKRKKP